MPEDTYIILANLLDFHPHQLSTLPKEDRLKAIIMNMKMIPLSLLYSTSKRISPRHLASQRWIPAEIGKIGLDPFEHMVRSTEGFVIDCGLKIPSRPSLIVVTPPLCRDSGPIWLRCSSPRGHHDWSPQNVWVRIDLFRLSWHTQYDPALYEESCILIDGVNQDYNYSLHSRTRAALLHRRKGKNLPESREGLPPPKHNHPLTGANKETFHITYDCPAVVTTFLEPESREKVRFKRQRKRLEKVPNPLKSPPWRSNIYNVCRINIPQASIVQDDCLIEKCHHINPSRSALKAQELVVDSNCFVRFCESWKLIIETGTNERFTSRNFL